MWKWLSVPTSFLSLSRHTNTHTHYQLSKFVTKFKVLDFLVLVHDFNYLKFVKVIIFTKISWNMFILLSLSSFFLLIDPKRAFIRKRSDLAEENKDLHKKRFQIRRPNQMDSWNVFFMYCLIFLVGQFRFRFRKSLFFLRLMRSPYFVQNSP